MPSAYRGHSVRWVGAMLDHHGLFGVRGGGAVRRTPHCRRSGSLGDRLRPPVRDRQALSRGVKYYTCSTWRRSGYESCNSTHLQLCAESSEARHLASPTGDASSPFWLRRRRPPAPPRWLRQDEYSPPAQCRRRCRRPDGPAVRQPRCSTSCVTSAESEWPGTWTHQRFSRS